MEKLELEVDGLSFSALAAGTRSARPVLLLHGFPQTSWSWHHQLEALAEAGYRALAFDQRGYSSHARPSRVDDYQVQELVGDALAVAGSQGWDRFDLVGHDWGAVVAWVLAALHPERLRTLTSVSVPHPAAFSAALGRPRGAESGAGTAESGAGTAESGAGTAELGVGTAEAGASTADSASSIFDSGAQVDFDSDQSRRSSYIQVFRAEGGVAERLLLGEDGSGDGLRSMFVASGYPPGNDDVEIYVRKMLEPGALTSALNWYRAMSADVFASVRQISVPTLYVWSTEDVALGRTAAEETVEWVSAPYRFEVLEGVSHWVPEAAPADLSRFLLEHLSEH